MPNMYCKTCSKWPGCKKSEVKTGSDFCEEWAYPDPKDAPLWELMQQGMAKESLADLSDLLNCRGRIAA